MTDDVEVSLYYPRLPAIIHFYKSSNITSKLYNSGNQIELTFIDMGLYMEMTLGCACLTQHSSVAGKLLDVWHGVSREDNSFQCDLADILLKVR